MLTYEFFIRLVNIDFWFTIYVKDVSLLVLYYYFILNWYFKSFLFIFNVKYHFLFFNIIGGQYQSPWIFKKKLDI